jgi:hypothetical protein
MRVWGFIAIVTLTLLGMGYYVLGAVRKANPNPAANLTALNTLPKPALLVVSQQEGSQRHLQAIARNHRQTAALLCDRLHYRVGVMVCLKNSNFTGVRLSLFDASFKLLHKRDLVGIFASRARVSDDGRYAAATVFVQGHSYADSTFSTYTTIVEVASGKSLGNLEAWSATKDGVNIKAADANIWGVSFVPQSERFYATYSTKGQRYLVEGNMVQRSFKVIHHGVECPSLSPDGKRIAFKKAVKPGAWQIALLDLATMQESRTAETRFIDDQIEWLDNTRLAYELRLPDSPKVQVWSVAADGLGQPERLLLEASSPSGVE